MKLVCPQNELNTHLGLLARAVPSRPSNPILSNVLLVPDEANQRASLTAFDLNLGIQTSFAAQIEGNEACALPAKLLGDLVSRLPQGDIALHCDADSEGEAGEEQAVTATLTSQSGQFQLRGQAADNFPELPVAEAGSEALQLPVGALMEGIGATLFAASTDETKQVLTGIHLVRSGEQLEFAATDGHRLAVAQAAMQAHGEAPQTASPELAVTIPARSLRELERLLAKRDRDETIALYGDASQLMFELDDWRLTSRKLEGNYPDYHQLIPQEFAYQITLERRSLLSALDRVAVMADRQNNIVKFSLDSDNQQLSLSVDAQAVGNAQERMPAEIGGGSIEVAFNSRYLADGLKALRSDNIQMQLNSPTQPVVFSPLGELKMTYLVMPVQLRS